MTVETGLIAWGSDQGAADELDALLQRCLNGDSVALAALYDRYAAQIFRLVYGMLGHREDAEEVLQDSFEYAFRRLHRFDRRKASFKTWLYQIAISRCRNKRRRKWLPSFSLNALDQPDIADPDAVSPAEHAHLSRRQRQVWEALQRLSPKLSDTAILRYYEGLTYQEIGQILQIPAKTAESRMRLAHRALRDLLDEQELD